MVGSGASPNGALNGNVAWRPLYANLRFRRLRCRHHLNGLPTLQLSGRMPPWGLS